jgi:FMN-dependent NADH-azoreductase
MAHTPKHILSINSSARSTASGSRQLVSELIQQLENEDTIITNRDVAEGLPFVNEEWVNANFTAPEDRTQAQKFSLAFSDSLVKELQDADTLIIGLPIYNFGIPSTLKAWIDMIARARLTFQYTADRPEGLLTGKKAYLIVTSGGTDVGSEIDFATSYLRHALKFIGIEDVTIIDAGKGNIESARSVIAQIGNQKAAA